jgi:two-component system, NarL family, vancomycin resistance associated response regulator VraR
MVTFSPMLLRQNSVLRVLIVDDHELTRFTLQLALKSEKNIVLVGLATNGLEAIAMVEQHHPDVIILDLQMPVMDGIAASKQIKSIAPETQILAYSSVEDPQVEVMVQTARIDAFCKKDVSTQELIATIARLGEKLVSH